MIFFQLFLCLLFSYMAAAPSDTLLEAESLQKIENHFLNNYSNSFVESYFNEKNAILKIQEEEVKEGFLGYHASSQYLRIMQDILKVVFEEKLEIPIRSDFYFFRAPGSPFYNMPLGIEDYINTYDKGIASQEEIDFLLSLFILGPLEKKLGIRLNSEEIDPEMLSDLILPLKDLKYALAAFFYSFKGEEIKKGFSSLYSFSPFDESVIAQIKYDESLLRKTAQKLYTSEMSSLIALNDFEKWFLNEYSPISLYCKFITHVNQTLFHSHDPLKRFFLPFLDYYNDTSSYLLSMNFSLFSNYKRLGDSSLSIYLNNESIAFKGEGKILHSLKNFFKEIGLKEDLAVELFYTGLDVLKKVKGGVLYQVYDSPSYPIACFLSYVSYSSGIPAIKVSLEKILKGELKLNYSETQHLQLRLLMTNEETLNPYSPLKIVRYDHTPFITSDALMNSLREKIKKAPQDISLKENYLKKIKKEWNL